MSDGADDEPAGERPGTTDAGDDLEEQIAQRRSERRRGTPPGREALPDPDRTARLLVVTVALVVASAAVLVGVVLLAG